MADTVLSVSHALYHVTLGKQLYEIVDIILHVRGR